MFDRFHQIFDYCTILLTTLLCFRENIYNSLKLLIYSYLCTATIIASVYNCDNHGFPKIHASCQTWTRSHLYRWWLVFKFQLLNLYTKAQHVKQFPKIPSIEYRANWRCVCNLGDANDLFTDTVVVTRSILDAATCKRALAQCQSVTSMEYFRTCFIPWTKLFGVIITVNAVNFQ